MFTFIGLDLAWKSSNDSGICWLQGDSPTNLQVSRLEVSSREVEILADEISAIEGTVIVAIDAPLICEPDRWVEREISRRFMRYKVGAHSPHAAMRKGWTAGIDLGNALTARGFTLDPAALLPAHGSDRVAVEVYPHTLHVRLFGLEERIRYKKGRVADRRRAMQAYQTYLHLLAKSTAPGILENDSVRTALAHGTAEIARGAALKRLDDSLDGLTCAIAAALMWRNPDSWECVGDLSGYMVIPRES